MSKNSYLLLVNDDSDDETCSYTETDTESLEDENQNIEECIIVKSTIKSGMIYHYIDSLDYIENLCYFEEILNLHQFVVDSEKNRQIIDISIRKKLGSLIEIVGKAFLESKLMHDGKLDHIIFEDNIFYQDIVYRLFYHEGKWINPLQYYTNSRSEKVPTLKSHVRLHFISLLQKAEWNKSIKKNIDLFYQYIREYSVYL